VCLNFIDIILFQDQNVKGLSDFFCTAVMNLGLTLVTVGSQGYGNGADSKIKSKQTQILYIDSKLSLYHVAPVT